MELYIPSGNDKLVPPTAITCGEHDGKPRVVPLLLPFLSIPLSALDPLSPVEQHIFIPFSDAVLRIALMAKMSL